MRSTESKPAKISGRTQFALLLAILLTVSSGILHARMSRLWGADEQLDQAAAGLEGLPEQFGPWQRSGTFELGQSAIELLQCRGYLNHEYQHQHTGQRIKVAVMVGPGSKISIHVPEICFEATNYTLIQERQEVGVGEPQTNDRFWQVVFQSNDISGRKLNVLYGWRADGDWVAPRRPRWSVAGSPVLYKLQLTEEAGQSEEPGADEFLQEFLPVLNRRLAGDPPADDQGPLGNTAGASRS